MIVLKLEMWPGGDESRAYLLGRAYIANDGEQSVENSALGTYGVVVCRRGSVAVPQPFDPSGPKPTRSGMVRDYPRQSYNVWRLIIRALRQAFPEER